MILNLINSLKSYTVDSVKVKRKKAILTVSEKQFSTIDLGILKLGI